MCAPPAPEVERTILPKLQTLLVQAIPPPPPPQMCGNAYMQHSEFIDRLDWMHRTAASFPFGLVPHGEWLDAQAKEDAALREWKDRIEGGPGCWDTEASWVNDVDVRKQ